METILVDKSKSNLIKYAIEPLQKLGVLVKDISYSKVACYSLGSRNSVDEIIIDLKTDKSPVVELGYYDGKLRENMTEFYLDYESLVNRVTELWGKEPKLPILPYIKDIEEFIEFLAKNMGDSGRTYFKINKPDNKYAEVNIITLIDRSGEAINLEYWHEGMKMYLTEVYDEAHLCYSRLEYLRNNKS